MKNIKNTLVVTALSAGLAAGTWSCQSVVEGHEVSPNAPTNVAAEQMLLGTELALNVAMQGEAARMSGIFVGYFTGADRQYISYEDYAVTSGDFNGFWGSAYAGVIKNCRVMQEKLTPLNNRMFIGVTQVMEAYAFGTLTSLFGDIPFSEAINDDIAAPAFDGQVSVYAGIQTILDDAIANLQSGAGSIPSGDLYYGSNAASWVELAYSLKARYYLHVGDYANALTDRKSVV